MKSVSYVPVMPGLVPGIHVFLDCVMPGLDPVIHAFLVCVMPGLDPGIHAFLRCRLWKTWMAGTSPAMTQKY
jgi:hypothetical protein